MRRAVSVCSPSQLASSTAARIARPARAVAITRRARGNGLSPPSSAVLERGATKLGWRSVEFARVFRYEANGRAVKQTMARTMLPSAVEAGAKAFSNIDHMVVLNGADGMSDMFAKALSLGGTGLGLARQLMDAMGGLTSSRVEAMANQNSDLSTRD